MHEGNSHGERPFEAASLTASLKEQGIVERLFCDDISEEMCRLERLSVEIAVEWAHLGGD